MRASLDLKSHRCPDMQSKLYKGLQAFISSSANQVLIKCIDPRFKSNLTQYLAMSEDMSVLELVAMDTITLSAKVIEDWEKTGHTVYPMDIEGISTVQLALVQKKGVNQ